MASMTQQFDLVIIGGGMVGTALAAALGGTDMKVALIEAQVPSVPASQVMTSVSDADVRVSALNRASQQFLEQLGAWQRIPQERLSPYDKMRVWDGEGTARIQFDAIELGEAHLGHIVENVHTASALMQSFQQHGNLQLFAPAKVTGLEKDPLPASPNAKQDWLIRLADGQTLCAPLVVGADGARSRVRQWAELETREWDYDHHGLVCTVQVDKSHQQGAWQRFTESGVLAFLPLADDNLCSIVWSCPEEQANELLALDADAFCVALTKAFETQLGHVQSVGPRAAIPLRQRHAKRYSKDGIVLVGDAAHTIHPLAGQGVNLGLMDAYVLADELKAARSRGVKLNHDQVLNRYERRRMPDNLAMMATMEGFKRLFAAKQPLLRWVRNWGMNKVNGLGAIKHHLIQEAMGLNKKIKV